MGYGERFNNISRDNFYFGFDHHSEFGSFRYATHFFFVLFQVYDTSFTYLKFSPHYFYSFVHSYFSLGYLAAQDLLFFSSTKSFKYFRSTQDLNTRNFWLSLFH